MRQLEEIFEMAVDRGGTEVILETGQPALVTTPRGGEPVGEEIDESRLFEILMGALSEEQQVELAVGNMIEFAVNSRHGDWQVIAEPGAEGMSVRARRGGAHTSVRHEGVHLPPATPHEIGPEDSVPPGAEPSVFATPSPEHTPTPPTVGGGAFDTPDIRGAARGPLDLPAEPPEEMEVSVDDDDDERSPFDPDVGAPELAPEGLDFDPDLRSHARDDPTIETATVPPPFAPPPPRVGEGSFSAPPVPASSTRPTPRDIPIAARPEKATVADQPAHRSSSTMMGISVPPATGEVPPVSQRPRHRTQDLPAAGSLTLTLGRGIARQVAEAEGKGFRIADSETQLRELVDAPVGDVLVLAIEDPSPHLGWALRRVEEGHTVMVETRATTAGGARRTLLGVAATARAEHWLDIHGCETLAFVDDEIVVLGD